MKLFTLLFFIISFNMINAQNNHELYDIIKLGTFAPSSHNAQMWLVKIINSNTISVFPNVKRELSRVDPNNRETWISIGAFVENSVQAAKANGYITMISTQNNAVQLKFEPGNTFKNSNTINLIKKRLTVRVPYINTELNNSEINQLTQLSNNVKYYQKNSEFGKKIISFSKMAYAKQMHDTSKLIELAEWMSFSHKEEKLRNDGLYPESLGMSGLKKVFFNLFMNKKSVTSKMFINGSIKDAYKQFDSCSGYILITSNSSKIADLINSGRILEQVWLQCTKLQIAVHPMSQVLEEIEYYKKLKAELGITNDIQMVLRVGKVDKYPSRIGKRLYLKDVIILD